MESSIIRWIDIIPREERFLLCQRCFDTLGKESPLGDVFYTEYDASSQESHVEPLCANHAEVLKRKKNGTN